MDNCTAQSRTSSTAANWPTCSKRSSCAQRVSAGEALRLSVGDLHAELNGELAASLVRLLAMVAEGQQVDITALPPVLTTGQAAELLRVSRPTVIAMIDRGELACSRVGSHRRVSTTDVLAIRDSDGTRRRRAALNELTRVSQDLGLYD
jgi:excisionase family DNA binding protein